MTPGEQKEMERIIQKAVDSLRPAGHGERVTLYNVISQAIAEARGIKEPQISEEKEEPTDHVNAVLQNAVTAESLRDAYTFSKECVIGGQDELAFTVWIKDWGSVVLHRRLPRHKGGSGLDAPDDREGIPETSVRARWRLTRSQCFRLLNLWEKKKRKKQ